MTNFRYNPYLDFLSGIILSNLLSYDFWSSLPKMDVVNVIGPYKLSQSPEGFNIVADSALNYYPGKADMIVSDLDGPLDKIIKYKDAIKVIHAHGDNIDKIIDVVPRLKGPILGTTQSIPVRNIRNIGGFTDGDRAIIMGKIMGAKEVRVYGFNWDIPVDEPKLLKKKKMIIGKEIVEKLTNIKITYMEGNDNSR